MEDLEELIEDLIYGGRAGDLDEIRGALAAGVAVDARDPNGTTALMMAAANGHIDAVQELLGAGAEINAVNERKNTALHWAVFTGQREAVKALLAAGGCNLMLTNEQGCTAAMDAERRGDGEMVVLLLSSLDDEDAAAAALGHGDDDEEASVQRVEPGAGVDKTLDGQALKEWQKAPDETLPATRGVLTGARLIGPAGAEHRPPGGNHTYLRAVEQRAAALEHSVAASGQMLVTRERPCDNPELARRVAAACAERTGDWRYSLVPAVVPAEKMLQFSRDFFSTTELLTKEGNTFGKEFEAQYTGHRNYFYYLNRNQVVPGAEKAAFIFEELDAYTRQVVEQHHPGAAVRLERAFGAYYEGERDGFHRGVNEHCDGDANLVSTVVHAVLPDGDVGFTEGGELTISEADELPATPITHSNETVGSVVYLGGSVFHHASPIKLGGRRLVFCMFYACEPGTDLSRHAFA